MRSKVIFTILFFVFTIISCENEQPTESKDPETKDEDIIKETILEPDKTTNIIFDEKLEVSFPSGSVSQNTPISIKELNSQLNTTFYTGIKPLGPLYIFTPLFWFSQNWTNPKFKML